jgi:tetratricopeptide (TPR) repeat protein
MLAFVVAAFPAAAQQEDTGSPSSPDMKTCAAMLRSRFHGDREEAVEVLGSLGERAVATLEQSLASDYPEERTCALRALCRAAPERAATVLVESVMHENISVRVAAVRAARSLDFDAARALLRRASELPQDKLEVFRSIIASACQRHVEEELRKVVNGIGGRGFFHGMYSDISDLGSVVEPALSKIASDPSHGLAEPAASALGELGDKAAIPALMAAYKQGSGQLRETAAAALHRLGEHGPFEEMEKEYKEGSEDGNSFSLRNLGHFYSRAGEYEKSEKIIRDMMGLSGGSSIDHFNLACALSRQDKLDEALEEFKKAVEKGFTSVEWMKIDGDIAKLRATEEFQAYAREKFPDSFKTD